jgi:hypothetical protein
VQRRRQKRVRDEAAHRVPAEFDELEQLRQERREKMVLAAVDLQIELARDRAQELRERPEDVRGDGQEVEAEDRVGREEVCGRGRGGAECGRRSREPRDDGRRVEAAEVRM